MRGISEEVIYRVKASHTGSNTGERVSSMELYDIDEELIADLISLDINENLPLGMLPKEYGYLINFRYRILKSETLSYNQMVQLRRLAYEVYYCCHLDESKAVPRLKSLNKGIVSIRHKIICLVMYEMGISAPDINYNGITFGETGDTIVLDSKKGYAGNIFTNINRGTEFLIHSETGDKVGLSGKVYNDDFFRTLVKSLYDDIAKLGEPVDCIRVHRDGAMTIMYEDKTMEKCKVYSKNFATRSKVS